MPRAAGSGNNYSFVLKNEATGRYDQGTRIELPSVTTIIGAVLAKPVLVPWMYRETRDYIAGTVSTLRELGVSDKEIVDLLEDSDYLEEYLTENRLRPKDTIAAAAERGSEKHKLLEKLGQASLEEDEMTAQKIAQQALVNPRSDGWEKGIADWWLTRNPLVEASEKVVYSLRYGYCGTVDLIWADESGNLIVTDLKTRGEGKEPYESDHIQSLGYKIAFQEMTDLWVDSTSVLVVREDGSWVEEPTILSEGIFLNVLDIYKALNEGRKYA